MGFLRGFRGTGAADQLIWTELGLGFECQCSQCQQMIPPMGKRYKGSSMSSVLQSHYNGPVLCEVCHQGRDPHRKVIPILAQRRTTLD